MTPAAEVAYVLGHSDPELTRLERQATFFAAETTDILKRGGLAPGMRVLDVGCGVGDVSMIAGRIVGPAGAVVGVDRSAEAVAVARRRAAAAGLSHVEFREADVLAMAADRSFDALVGRFILLHLPDPVDALRRLTGFLRPGALVAFAELDIGAASTMPELPLVTRCVGWVIELYRRVGAEPNMGSRLYGTFRAAGLTPELHGTCRVEGGPDAFAYELLAGTLRSMAPSLFAMGVVTERELDLDTLAHRLREASVAGDHCIVLPRFIGAWARLP